jgi:hypothetical protein
MLIRCVASLLIVTTAAVGTAAAQSPAPVVTASVWRGFSERLPAAAQVRIRLESGQRFTATLVEVQADGLLVQPKTRLPVPVQRVAYDDIASMEQVERGSGSVGKAVAIGIASGAGAFLTLLLIALSSWD